MVASNSIHRQPRKPTIEEAEASTSAKRSEPAPKPASKGAQKRSKKRARTTGEGMLPMDDFEELMLLRERGESQNYQLMLT